MTPPPPVPRSAPAPRPEVATDVVLPSQLFSALGQGFLVLDEAGTVLHATSTAAELLGTDQASLVGRPCPLQPPHAASRPSHEQHPRTEQPGSPLTRLVPPLEQPRLEPPATSWFAPPGSGVGGLPAPRPSTSPTGIPPVREPIAVRPEPGQPASRSAERRQPPTAERWTHRVTLADGEVRRLLITSTPLPGGRTLSLIDITEVHAQAAALTDPAAAAKLTDLALWEFDLESERIMLSPQLVGMLGLPDDTTVTPETWQRWLDPEDRDLLPRLTREARGGQSTWRLLLRITPPDGKARYLRHWCHAGFDAQGRVTSITGACLDVTDGGLAAEELRTSRRRLQAAVRLTGLASWSMRVDGSQLWWSEGMYALFGKDVAGEVPTAAEHFDLTHPDDLPRLLRCLDRVLATGVPDEIDLRVQAPSGTRHLRCWIDVAVDDDLQQTVLGSVLDVTEQARTMGALQTQREEFRLAFHAAPIGMAVLFVDDAGGRTIRRVNPALRDLLGLPGGELADAQLMQCFPPEARRVHGRALRELTSGAATEKDYEVAFHRPDGEPGHLWIRAGVARQVPGRADGRVQVLYHVLDVTQRERDRQDLHKLAMTDPLTGLANRARFQACLDDALSSLGAPGDPGAALFLVDLDRFKAINDTLGHVTGDALLVEVARRLRAAAPPHALVARLGGDEFALLVRRHEPVHRLQAIGEQLRAALAEPHRFGEIEGVTCTATIGIADLGDAGRRPADAYREADLALYAAKDAGRNTVVVADERLRDRLRHQRRMETLIRQALDGDRIRIQWQPAVDLATGQVVGHEALARIEDGDGNVLMPEQFLPVAVEMGAVADLDCRISELAVAHLARTPGTYAAVNVSARTLACTRYVERLQDCLAAHGVAPARLLVELDETSLLSVDGEPDSPSPAERAVRELHQLGVRIGLDDFGTGYSALTHLERFPLDFLKLDHTFVARLNSSPTAESLVQAVVDLAHGYGMTVTAEGVETEEQVQTLHRVGCDRAQGWLFDAHASDAQHRPDVWRTA